MTERREMIRELARRAAVGFPRGVALVYLVFLLGSLFALWRRRRGQLSPGSRCCLERRRRGGLRDHAHDRFSFSPLI